MSALRSASWLLGVVWRLQPALWGVSAVMLLIGVTGQLQGKVSLAGWLTLIGALLLLISAVARWLDYTIFLPGLPLPAAADSERGLITYGLATGTMHLWDRFAWVPHEKVTRLSVQVRWQAEKRPPFIAVVAPDDLPETLPDVLKEADVLSLWYPGVTAEPGTVLVDGTSYPGLRLSFPGKRLLLALPDEETVARLCQFLRE